MQRITEITNDELHPIPGPSLARSVRFGFPALRSSSQKWRKRKAAAPFNMEDIFGPFSCWAGKTFEMWDELQEFTLAD